MIDKENLVGFFNNIIPATFQESVTYMEQLELLKDKLNEIIDVLNSIVDSGGSGYILNPATRDKLGGIIVGENLDITEEGVLSATVGGITDIPIATGETLGGIIVGENLSITNDGVLSAPEPTPAYELPIAGVDKLGGVKDSRAEVVSIAGDGTIFLKASTENFDLKPIANGGYGNWLWLKPATANTLGGVKIGEGINIDENGIISVVIPEQKEIQLGQGLKLVDGKITLDLGVNLYFTEDGKVNAVIADPVVVTTGIQDSVSTTKDSSSNDGLSETIGEVSEELNFSKY